MSIPSSTLAPSEAPPPMPRKQSSGTTEIHALSQLLLTPAEAGPHVDYVAALSAAQREELVAIADSHHVVIRAFAVVARNAGDDAFLRDWTKAVLAEEEQRIQNALVFLHHICSELETAGCPIVVMKSLDHWPDLGNDLDLYTTADQRQVIDVMLKRMGAHIEARSWGDRLANKWNFAVPGLPESVEVHAQRLGQTGEHIALARRFVQRRVTKKINGLTFLVPAAEERIVVATLQRMYRHFYFRLCDIANTSALLEAGEIDFVELKRAADLGGIWPGVATYLKVVCDYVRRSCGSAPALPAEVVGAAQFGGEAITVGGKFLRVPIVPHGARLYTQQVTKTALRGDVAATLRLSLLPYLASAAAVAYRITGSDKGIW